ncbi:MULTISPECIES: hypothetical protein [Pasteurellaceae]|uniref:hypothetical protein n=1 Tax=Pasteurellaceae TaxID=712 RepID=UPI0024414133|nr:hypothetical protein [Actinobacillus equuli]WGE85348.1 hypothetical protein NYR87_09535 [Actinobacillus equuli subsp. haemolyticus]
MKTNKTLLTALLAAAFGFSAASVQAHPIHTLAKKCGTNAADPSAGLLPCDVGRL